MQVRLKRARYYETNLGINAVVALFIDGKEVFRNEVKLWRANSREKFAKLCRDAHPNVNVSVEDICTKLRRIEKIIEHKKVAKKISDEDKKSQGGVRQPPAKPQVKLITEVSLLDVHCALQEIISSPHCGDVLEYTLASVINAKRVKDGHTALWFFIIGVPSSGKTEAVEGVKHESSVYFLDTLTDRSFITGFISPDGSRPEDLLQELDGKCLVIKDLTPLFAGREEITKSILGDLVGIYDKSFARFTGTRGKVAYNSCFSFIACITPKAIQRHHRYIAEMGSRLLYYRLPSLSSKDQKEGFELILKEKKRSKKVDRYQLLCSSYAHILLNCELPTTDELTAAQIEQIQTLAELLSRGRAIISDVIQIEEPFRIASQLKELAIDLAMVHVSETVNDHEMELASRVVLSTIPYNRASVLALFQDPANLLRGAINSLHFTSLRIVRVTPRSIF